MCVCSCYSIIYFVARFHSQFLPGLYKSESNSQALQTPSLRTNPGTFPYSLFRSVLAFLSFTVLCQVQVLVGLFIPVLTYLFHFPVHFISFSLADLFLIYDARFKSSGMYVVTSTLGLRRPKVLFWDLSVSDILLLRHSSLAGRVSTPVIFRSSGI
ncbi:hypothetical protein C8J57DRAFT_193424 [Mycena rebaudengoi]|nr:hypothetical protein C8J57DRAFT_193424 [Mycena rebaudengoi]